MGCLPSFVSQLKPQNSKCVDSLNSMVLKFNEKLPLKLQGLASSLPGSNFVVGNNYEHILNLVENPNYYGIQVASVPCCALTPFGTCDGKRPPCEDRKSHVFFDAFHPTEAAYKILAQNCFGDSGACIPMNIRQLASI
ncbi:GDSL esterase/lipase 7 [Morus notabilis]|uniref:GDSL esterase/lipase 7 n=2 Tax=Morus notabilis TaxID=981085 RepID=W9S0Z6_9ROSA|nr:GDSL esterase/lipase 7 [Morus notabilis]